MYILGLLRCATKRYRRQNIRAIVTILNMEFAMDGDRRALAGQERHKLLFEIRHCISCTLFCFNIFCTFIFLTNSSNSQDSCKNDDLNDKTAKLVYFFHQESGVLQFLIAMPNNAERSTAGRMLAPLATAEEIDVLQAEEAVQVCTSTSSSESSSRSSNRTSSSAWSSEMTAGTTPNNDDADDDDDDAHRLLAIVDKNSPEQFSEIGSEINEKELLSKGAHFHLTSSEDFGNDIQMLATRLSQMLMSTKGCLPPPPSSSTSSILVDWLRGSSSFDKQNLMPMSLQCLKYDSGFGSIFSSSLSTTPFSGSATVATLNNNHNGNSNNHNNNNSTVNLPLPPPPPYRRISLPSARPLRIYRSYSDSKHRSCRRFDGYHYSPCCGWSAASSRSPSPSMSTVSCPEYGDLQDKLHRLESDRESLSLQVSVLAEQVGAQTEKIKDLESMLEDKKTKLDSTEEMLHEELVTRSSLETNKLDLMAEISNLKLKMAALEREKYEREQQLKTAKSEIAQLQKIVRERQDELDNNAAHLPSSAFDANDISRLVRKLRTRTDEVDKLRLAVQNLLTKNVEKEHQIEHLQKCIDLETIRNFQNRSSSRTADHFCSSVPRSLSSTRACDFYSNQEMDFNDHLRKLLLIDSAIFPAHTRMHNDSQAKHSSSAQENFLLDDCCYRSGMTMTMMNANNNNNNINYCSPNLPNMAPVLAPSSPYLGKTVASRGGCAGGHPSTLAMAANHYAHAQHSGSVNHNDTCYTTARQLAAELDQLAVNFPRPTLDSIYQTGSLPRQITLGTSKKFENGDTVTDNDDTTSIRSTARFSEQQPFKRGRKYSSLRNFVSKIKRSTSEEIRLTNDQQSKLKQEVVASSRLGRKAFDIHGTTTMDTRADRLAFLKPPMGAFCKWDADQLSEWLCELGLSCYITDCRRSIQSGRHLINMSDIEVEKILGMKNPLHRKRLKIALSAIESAGTVVKAAERMDFHQTLRWLDDIGLPQYRESFANYRIDGIMLDELTVDDLLHMHITSALHHASIRRGIQMLRMSGYSLNRLNRKFDPHVVTRGSCASSVQFWTQHCISEWLRSSDLTEFTPNLMCSGIHGALMVLDPTFTAESLAAVLQIPQQKTLLRRHLATQFTNLIGADLVAAKRQFLAQSEMPILSPLLKVKLQKKSGFSLTKKKGKHEIFYEPGELVCPIAKASLSSLLQFDQQDKSKKPSARNRPTVSEKLLDKLTSTNV
ncbi:Liprin-beta [Trichinella murrelli]|uniref:Liprin-beta n=1 Tax=Trichinella murrelli TaxID=144512 RepID=A0A0V0TDU5_9BILA|nr:Liprin-beta [Trichinella murrelli]